MELELAKGCNVIKDHQHMDASIAAKLNTHVSSSKDTSNQTSTSKSNYQELKRTQQHHDTQQIRSTKTTHPVQARWINDTTVMLTVHAHAA